MAAKLATVLLLAHLLSGCLTAAGPVHGWDRQAIGADDMPLVDHEDVVVMLLDGRVDTTHPAFAHMRNQPEDYRFTHRIVVHDFIASAPGGPEVPAITPPSDHATAIAALIAGKDGDWQGLAPRVLIFNAVVCTETLCDVNAIKRALEHASGFADIVSISISNPTDGRLDGLFDDRIAGLVAEGAIVITSVGNRGPDGQANGLTGIREVVSVGSAGPGGPSAFSSRGRSVPCPGPGECLIPQVPLVVAPGEAIHAPATKGGYDDFHGSSFAVPYVTAAAALAYRSLPDGAERTEAFRSLLAATAAPFEGQDLPHDAVSGYGMLRLDALLTR